MNSVVPRVLDSIAHFHYIFPCLTESDLFRPRSSGVEHLPFKQRVGGSSPPAVTPGAGRLGRFTARSAGDRQRVGSRTYVSSLDTSFTLLRVLVVSTHRLHLEEVIGGSFDLDRFTEFILDGFDLQPRCPLRGFVVHGQCLLGGVDGRPDIFTTEILVNKEGFVEDADVALLVDPSDEVDLSRSDGQFDRRIKRESLREAAERKTTRLLFSKLVFFVALVVVMLVTEASRFFLQVLEVSYFL